MTYARITHRFGLLTPSSNTTQEPEFREVLPSSVSLHAGRLTLNNIDGSSTLRIVEELETESRKLADAEVDVVVLAATAPSSRGGKGYDRELIGRMEAASGKPAVTASTALLDALSVLGVNRLALIAPWTESVNDAVASFMEAHGVEIPHRAAMGLVRNNDVGRLDPDRVYEFARGVDSSRAEALLLACGNWWTMSVVERLERDLGKPVLTTNGVSIWAALKVMGACDTLSGYGQLLRGHLRSGASTKRAAAA
ncbi:MAG: maleate cis-trans isomerase family protein [Burkholderiales bacterium]